MPDEAMVEGVQVGGMQRDVNWGHTPGAKTKQMVPRRKVSPGWEAGIRSEFLRR
jgi:hypothetical protein